MNTYSYQVDHYTDFSYQKPIRENVLVLSMMPLQDECQTINSYNLKITPEAKVSQYKDQHNNTRHSFNILKEHSSLKIHSSFKVTVKTPKNHPDSLSEKIWEDLKNLKESGEMWNWFQFNQFIKISKPLKNFLSEEKIEKQSDPLTSLITLNSKLFSAFNYTPQSTDANSTTDEILTTKKGVCQDYTHVMISIARLWGIPTRYVSGYLYQEKEEKLNSLTNETHAWCECYLPSLGWLGFDPTNNRMTGAGHIRTAIGTDYKEVRPHNGFFKGDKTDQLNVRVTIKKIDSPY